MRLFSEPERSVKKHKPEEKLESLHFLMAGMDEWGGGTT
jgi:hypothetical protein